MPISHIYVWNEHSEGANNLKQEMGIRKIRHENSRFVGNPRKIVLNWGASELPAQVARCQIINRPEHVSVSSNKLSFLRKLGATSELIPPWTEDFDVACSWIREGNLVFARTILNGSSGNGIVIMDRNDPNSFIRARLYVKYIKKAEEYRVHVVRDNVIDIQRKVLSRERAEQETPVNWKIRNLDNGFIYQRNDISPNEEVLRVAREALRISELDFGGVDVIWNSNQRRAYVLEINSAPGLQGTTVVNYANALRRL